VFFCGGQDPRGKALSTCLTQGRFEKCAHAVYLDLLVCINPNLHGNEKVRSRAAGSHI
jgi:hypothetical protein